MKLKAILVFLLLSTITGRCFATQYTYFFEYRTTDPGWKMSFNTWGSDSYEVGRDYPMTGGSYPVNVGLYKETGVQGWDGPSGFYILDARAPLAAGDTAIQTIYLWASGQTASQNLNLYQSNSYSLSPGLTYKLSLVSLPVGIIYTGPREWGADHGTITLPFYAAEDGTTGYKFLATITAVPEPSSLLALFSGLAGVGFAVRWKRK